MSFWGVEIKTGKPYTLSFKKRLRISQATLGVGTSNKSCYVQCNVGNKAPLLLCSLLPEKSESIHLDLEFEEVENVTFSVIGPRSIHLTGYVVVKTRHFLAGDHESESFGEDIRDTDNEESDEVGNEDEYGGSFIDDDDPSYATPSHTSSEEVKKDDKTKGKRKRLIKKYEFSESEDDVLTSLTNQRSLVQIDDTDEDDQKLISSIIEKLPVEATKRQMMVDPADLEISDSQSDDGEVTRKKLDIFVQAANNSGVSLEKEMRSKRRSDVHATEAGECQSSGDSKKMKMDSTDGQLNADGFSVEKELRSKRRNDPSAHATDDTQKLGCVVGPTIDDSQSNDRKVKRKKRKHHTNALSENGGKETDLGTRTISGGLVIEDLEIGKPDGKVASSGKKVTIHYTGRLKQQDTLFCSIAKDSPLKFRLGKGAALDGLHLGIDGMRVGGQRRLTIPPELGYGSEGTDGVPPHSWLVMEVTLAKVR